MDFDERASRGAEAIYQTQDMAESRRRTIEALRLTPGARVLDVGSGPGLFADEMAPDGRPDGFGARRRPERVDDRDRPGALLR